MRTKKRNNKMIEKEKKIGEWNKKAKLNIWKQYLYDWNKNIGVKNWEKNIVEKKRNKL